MENLAWAIAASIAIAILGFPFVVIARKPEKYFTLLRAIQLCCATGMLITGAFAAGIEFGQRNAQDTHLAEAFAASLWIILLLFMAYWGALAAVKHFLHD